VLEPRDVLKYIDAESAAAAATISSESLAARVPSCPDWSFSDLIWHLGRVQRFWARIMYAGDVEPEFPPEEPAPADADELTAWFRASTRELLDALQAVPWDTPAWVWWKEDRTVGAIARHQVQEAAVHRWDAQLAAAGRPDPLPAKIAEDGVDEFLWIARQMRGPAPIAFNSTETGAMFVAGTDKPVVTVTAAPSDLVLLLYGRVSTDEVLVEGDRDTLDAFLAPIG
jgi:uncharacterized protein (TIGR03083 family)